MKIPVSNNTAMSLYVGAAMVPPGETRHFEESDVSHHLRPAKDETPAVVSKEDPLAKLLQGNVKDIAAALPGMTMADIERLGELEQQGQARKGVLSAVSTALLDRAANSELLAKVAALSDDELAAALVEAGTDVNADPDYVAALESESAKRKAE